MPAASTSELQRAVDALLKREKGWESFNRKPPVGARPGGIGTGQPASASSASVALEERDATLRTYHAPRAVRSVDGLLTFMEEPIETVVLIDGSIKFADPGADAE